MPVAHAAAADGFAIWTEDLAPGALEVASFRGEEALSAAYSYRVELVTELPFAVAEGALLGRRARLFLASAGQPRTVAGVVRSVESLGARDTRAGLRAALAVELVPRLALLRERVAHRIFQDAGADEIARSLLDAWGVPCRFALHEDRDPWEYCVQYGESDYDFLLRVLAAEGIFFHFAQPSPDAGPTEDEIVVLGDTPAAHEVPGARWFAGDGAADGGEIDAAWPVLRGRVEGALGDATGEQMLAWRRRRTLAPGAVTLRDYRPSNARFDLVQAARAEERIGDVDRVYTFLPARRLTGRPAADAARARRELERVRGQAHVHEGRTTSRALAVGRRFHVEESAPAELDGEFVVVRLACEGRSPKLAEDGAALFEARVEARRSDEPLRPPPGPARPAPPLDTAVVVGPAGAEVHTDTLGRVKVQFRWDLDRPAGEHSSAWLRVAQPWSGAGFGAAFLPRPGMEVLVSYVGGDVNRPIVTGCVPNSDNPGPFAMPAEQTRTGIVSRSVPGGGDGNQLYLDDAAGGERIVLHAHRDLETRVRREQRTVVDGDQKLDVGGARAVKVRGDRTGEIEANDALAVGGSRRVDVAGAHALRVGGAASASYAADLGVEVRGGTGLRVAGDTEVRLDGRLAIGLEADAVVRAEEHTALVVGAHAAPRSLLVHVEGTSVSEATRTLELCSDEAIRLRVGDSSILLTKDAIQLSAAKVRLDAAVVEIVGDTVSAKASELARVEGKKAFLLSEGASVCLTNEAKIDGAKVRLKAPPDASDGPAARPKAPPPTKIKLADQDGNPVPGERFVVTLGDGTERSGVLDENGEAVLPDVEGSAKIAFPDLPAFGGG